MICLVSDVKISLSDPIKVCYTFKFFHIFTISPAVSAKGSLHIPAQDIPVHKGLTALEVKVIGVRIDMGTRRITGRDTVVTMIDTSRPFDGVSMPLLVPGEGTLVVTLQIRSVHKEGITVRRQYQAADIIAVIAPKIIRLYKKHTHPQKKVVRLHTVLATTNARSPIFPVQRE